jgi:hypothetical protein
MKKHLDGFDLNLHERKIYSQNGEDGIIEFIFSKIGSTNKFSVEFGVGNGFESNTTYLLEKKGWKGLMMDYGSDEKIKTENLIKKGLSYRKFGIKYCLQKSIKFLKKTMARYKRSRYFQYDIKKEKVTAENIEKLFQKYNVPKNFDLLSIDIDFNDYWVWKAITNYHPNVVVIEYNSSLPPTESRVVQYDPEAVWDGTNYFGASLLALQNLGHTKGYTLLGCDSNGVNAFFCKNEIINGIKINGIQYLYKPPKYGKMVNGIYTGHPPSDKKMIKI